MLPRVIGHRGARSRFPENTLEGIAAAIAQGVRDIEIDVAMTRDGVLVLSHDPRLSPAITRDCGGAWLRTPGPRICEIDYATIQTFDVGRLRPGSRYGRGFPAQRAHDGARMPRLSDALALDDRVRWTIEIKTMPRYRRLTAPCEQLAEAVADSVDRAAAGSRVVIQSFDWRGPRHLRRRRPDLAYAWLTCSATRAWRGGQLHLPHSVLLEGGGTWSPRHTELTRRRLDMAHHMGLRVVPWTVNARRDVMRLASWGVDGIITDDPVAVAGWLSPAGLPT